MWLKKLKRKKVQCLLIGALLFLSSLIFASSLSMMTSIKGYVKDYYANDKLYDLILYNSNESAAEDIQKWCSSNSNIKEVKAFEAFASGNDVYRKEENLKISMYAVVPLEDTNNLPFAINSITSLNNESCPREGEVWVTQLLAKNFNIALGDTLTFKTKGKEVNLKVTSLINDSNQPSSLSSQIIFYTNKNNAKDFYSLTKAPLVFIDAKAGKNYTELLNELTNAVKVGGFSFNKNGLINTSTTVSSAVGGMCTLASLLVFIVSVMLIRYILWNNIFKEYKSIGIYKALGFSKKKILGLYIIGYSLIAFVGSVLGAICSIPVINFTASRVLKYIGKFNGVSINFSVILATIVIFSFVVIINLYFVIRRTNKISPVEALRTGVTSSKKKLTKSLIKNTTAPLALAVNDIFKYKKISAFITLALTLALTLVLLFGNLNMTITKMQENTNIWFGLPKSNLTISAPLATSTGALKEVINEIKSDSRVENYVYGSILYSGVELDTKKYPIDSSIYDIFVMNSYDNTLGFTIINGHNPKCFNEVAVGLNLLKETGLSVGDNIELSINNKKNSYLITGSYNSMMCNGYGIRMLNAAIEKENPDFLGSELFLNLKDTSQLEAFKKEMNDKFSNLDANEIHTMLKYTIGSIPGTIFPLSSLLIVVFIAFSSITILNIIAMIIRDNRRNFGIMKSLGFSSKDIRNRYLYRILILTLFSTIIAVILNLTAARPIIAAAISNLDVLIISPETMIMLLAAMILLIILITFACCRTIKNTKPTELIEE